MDKGAATDRFLGRGNSRLSVALGPVTLSGVIVEAAETGLATAIYPLRRGGVLSSA
jgi:calcineurin-like phosphoesterase